MFPKTELANVRKFVTLCFMTAVMVAGLLIVPGSNTSSLYAANGDADYGPTAVDPELRSQLAANPIGGVEAVVTTWRYEDLDAVKAIGVQGTRLTVLPMILTLTLTQAQLDDLENSPAVRSVYANHTYDLYMEDTSWLVKARETWLPPEEGGLGVTGEGVHIAVIDTGADGLHEDMDNLVEFCETLQAATSSHVTVLCSPFDPASGNAGPAGPFNDARLDAVDDNGHGSHVAGTIAGSGDASGGREASHSTIGLAPDAKIHAYSANVGPTLANHQILAAYDDMTRKKLLGLNQVVAVNNSWGGGTGASYSPEDPVHVAVEAAFDAGILSVFAAGNSGPEHNTLSRQCVNPFVVCVGATTKNDSVVMFSSRGRPSEPADTNRDGVVGGPGDVAPDNHDRALGQALSLGLYRPALTAPGVNINAIKANALSCREGPLDFDIDCYEPLNGTSMATPHVSGAVALITQAYREAHGVTPSPNTIIDILERSANLSKLPGYEAEEQGAGRLDVYTAVAMAQSDPHTLPAVNWGTATPPFATDAYPGGAAATTNTAGCTSALSWSTGAGYGQHIIDVPEKTDRLRITVDWAAHPSANLYIRLWRPGVDPDAESNPAGPDRVFPDQEALGLVFVGTSRWLDVRTPEAGEWTLRVLHRAGGASSVCNPASTENPKQTLGFNYNLKIETPLLADVPTVAITQPTLGTPINDRYVEVAGTAAYPNPWPGVTNWNVPGSGNPGDDDRLVLHFHGNLEEGCTGDGRTDLIACDGPFLLGSDAVLSIAPAASWYVADPLLNGAAARNIYDPNWVWRLDEPTTLSGPMTVRFWASCSLCAAPFSADWYIRLWADGVMVFEERQTASPLLPSLPSQLELTVDIPGVTANDNFVLHVDPVYIDVQANTFVYYDSVDACPGATTGPCDSVVYMPVADSTSSDVPGIPVNVRVTDAQDRLVVAWAPVAGVGEYDIHRSTDPAFTPDNETRLATTAGESCHSPNAPSWPGASFSGLCYTDNGAAPGTTYYYRVVARNGDLTGRASLLAYGAAQAYDRQVKVGFDRLWGPRVWEYATLLDNAATQWQAIWDTLELDLADPVITARSFTQGVGSANAALQPPPPPAIDLKVTGGGKVHGEVPPGDDNGIKEATFGFQVATRGGEVSGYLNYRDHETNVSIRAVSIDSLSVAANQCSFSGQAEVQRNGTTTIESFTVTCEDNGNPGAGNDIFQIVTVSYSGGGVLTGGNVQIHDQ
jgi:serine protease AprX